MRLYIDTHGRSKGLWRTAPNGARVAAHTDRGVIELTVHPDGRWFVNEGPRLAHAGHYELLASGQIIAPTNERES